MKRWIDGCYISTIDITEPDVLNLLRKLKSDKSPGPDNLHPRVLKECAAELARPLTLLFKTSMKDGTLPQAWKEANVTPIFKKGTRSDASNYRPVSLTSVCCKILEKLVRNALLKHMLNNNYMSDCQHGFVQRHSCTTQ